jgi:putative ABC transport system permease protein
VDDFHFLDTSEALRPLFFVPMRQDTWGSMAIVARTSSRVALAERSVRAAVARANPEVPVAQLRTLDDALRATVAPRRFSAALLACFAGLAVALAAIGVYGVLAYAVAQRERELGIRMALGARRLDVLNEVTGEAARTAGLGVAIGLVAALVATRSLVSLLYGVSATDPATFVAVAAALFGVAIAASLAPAIRAARVSPAEVIRVD